MDQIPPGIFDNLSSVAVVLIVGWLIATGRLITRREADGIRKDRDDWHSASTAAVEDARLAAQQVSELLEHAKVSDALLRGLSEVANREKT